MWRKQQRFSNFNTPGTASGLLQAFAITSDPQYPWTNNTDAGIPEDDDTKKRRSEELIREQYNNVNNYMNNLPSGVPGAVLINGDMTAFGHGNEWDKINSLVGILNRPYYFGLGNHDIENNFNACANNGCFKNSLNYLQGHVRRHNNIPSSQFDYSVQEGIGGTWACSTRERRQGSFAYAFDMGNICFIQLQHNPSMNKHADITSTNCHEYHIYPNRNWVENQLRRARDSGKIIIVNVHFRPNIPLDYINLFQQYGVVVTFDGHMHSQLGNFASGGGIPNFRSGSASQRTYLILEQYADRLEIYTVRDNNWRNRQLVHTIPITHPISGRFRISTALDTRYVLNVMSGNNVGLYDKYYSPASSSQIWNVEYNYEKKAYRIVFGITNLVLAWNAEGTSRNVFVTPFVPMYDEHYWILEPYDNGYIFRNKKNTNLVLDVENSQASNYTNIQVRERNSLENLNKNQTFILESY
ncbi:hypothetical protein EXW59_00815 (plasmid) [Bacillus mycoides]|uniref:RICIN domain-containing protein n=1 Tax=Bacillus mycoides TaxID=1405 RepID=UPI001C00EA77|nr:RICIN domain-containing protein [Bacillus mycoides]QWH75453.1 hypothetical protein EXW59_00815 [Bacillus mycoides]